MNCWGFSYWTESIEQGWCF